ncbi:MAG: substrate-binding domain-containing protein [Pseudomonadota bacterium]
MRILCCFLVFLASAMPALADGVFRLAVTTSVQNSGLADHLLPLAEEALDFDIQAIVVGTGQALRLGAAGDVDAVLVHSEAAERDFVAAGFGSHRREIMYNDFVLLGPAEDPAGIAKAGSPPEAMAAIAAAEAPFVSRGDDSGTHRRELALWAEAGIAPEGRWYREGGSGMGATLNIAAAMGAYVLSDRASWLASGNRASLALLVEDPDALFNQYSFIPVTPPRRAGAKGAAGLFETWLTGSDTQALIGEFRIDGMPLFLPNARPQ